MTGRARGRGVARGRAVPTTAEDPGAVRRPGTATQPDVSTVPQSAPVTALLGAEAAVSSGTGAGRASHRGAARGPGAPGASMADAPATMMAQMSLGTSDARERRPNREMVFTEPNTRPAHMIDKRGTSGNSVPLVTNYFKVLKSPDWRLYQYHVDFSPEVESRKMRRGMMFDHAKLFGTHVFDGMQLYSSTKLPDEITEVFCVRKYDSAQIRVTIKRVAELAQNSPVCLHIFNILFRQILHELGFKEVQRAYYNPKLAITLHNHKLQIWPGFKTSILQYEEAIMLNVDVSHKVLRTDSVLDVMYDIFAVMGPGTAFQDECMRRFVGEIVLTRYNDKTYRVDDIEWDIHPRHTFKKKDQDISYREYYMTMYGVKEPDPDQPMLVSRPKKKDLRPGQPELIYLLPELCLMTGLTDEMRSNFTIMKELAVHTRVEPSKRAEAMSRFMSEMSSNQKIGEKLNGWGIRFEEGLLELQGRNMPPEKIFLGSDRPGPPRVIHVNAEADWGRDIRGKLYTTVNLDCWALVYFQRNQDVVGDFLQTMQRVAPPMGIRLSEPTRFVLTHDSTGEFINAIRQAINPRLQMVVCVLPTNKKDRYDAIKKQACVETPVPSQCVTVNVLRKPRGLMSVVSKIVIQLNCKMGGEAWAVEVPLKRTMIIGIDTYHDSAKKGRSVAGFVASLNLTFTRYYSQCTFQSTMQELSDGLKASMQAALKKYHSVNNELPDRIVIYRDGVGDGQLPAVVEYEVPQILEAVKAIGTNYNPKITFVVVKKRINTRFFYKGRELGNPGPGTVIDTQVTRPESYDFFVVSQSVRQGTVTPTHYNVIWDTSGLVPDLMQRLTYKMCHLYYNWPGTVRVPAPCQYAHKLAFLVGQSIHRAPDLSLADKLYYL